MKGIGLALIAVVVAASILLVVPGITVAEDHSNDPLAWVASVTPFNDPYVDKQWALPHIPLPTIDTANNNEVLVAVLDTGIDVNHEDLAGKIVESINFSSSNTIEDMNGHGTHVAGIIAADMNNGIGIVGAAPHVKLLNVKICEDNGTVWASNVAKGIIWATDRGAKVINISLVVPANYQPLEEAVNYAWRHGVVLAAAAGNYIKTTTYPAAYDNVIAVAAITPAGELWSGSNNGAFVDAYAPGADILSTLPRNKYGYLSGSSMATAYVSAMAANSYNQVIDANNSGANNDEAVDLVKMFFGKP
jgi:thermitase